MGVKDLKKLLIKKAPNSIKASTINQYSGHKVAIDVSINIYNSLKYPNNKNKLNLIGKDGKVITHLLGIFSNAVRMVNNGIEPVYVFEGKPPKLKYNKLNQREQKRGEAQRSLNSLKENLDAEKDPELAKKLAEQAANLLKQTVRPPTNYKADCKRLLELMGIPSIQAPSEAEAQCAALCKAGKVFAAVSEDMDTLAFSSPILLRGFNRSRPGKIQVTELNLKTALDQLRLNQESFIDLCILMGSDYCDTIKNIGPYHALSLIQKHGNIETILKNIDLEKCPLPDNFNYQDARELFLAPNVTDVNQTDLNWCEPNKTELIEYLVEENGFNKRQVLKSIVSLEKGLNSINSKPAFWLI